VDLDGVQCIDTTAHPEYHIPVMNQSLSGLVAVLLMVLWSEYFPE
jgi:hypothetical protein